MASAILPASLTILRPSNQSLSSCRALAAPNFFGPFSFSSLSIAAAGDHASRSIIRMGGGPRTFPGGVSKWQWKRMQAKKAKQLLKARLCRERQLYEMRKRAELKAAISELERPWEVVERAPVLFSASADEQVKVLADRFQRPNGFDMWSERDGPQIFRYPEDLPSARFFPKGAVHSVKPYSGVTGEIPDGGGYSDEGDEKIRYNDWIARGAGGIGRGRRVKGVLTDSGSGENVISRPAKLLEEDSGDGRGSYYSDSEVLLAELREEKERSGVFHRISQNHGSPSSEKKFGVTDSRLEGDEMDGEFARGNDRSRISYPSDSELELAGPKMKRDEMMAADSSGRISNRSSQSLVSEITVTGSRMEAPQKIFNGLDQRGTRGGRQSRGGRNGSRGSYRSHSVLSLAGSKMEGDGVVRDFNRRGVRGHNRDSHFSNSEIGHTGSGMNGQDIASSRRGRRGGYRGSYRSHSALPLAGSKMEGDGVFSVFNRRGARGHNQDSNFSNSEIGLTSSGMNGHDIASSRRGGRGRRGGGYRGSHWSYSELTDDDSSTGRHIAGDFDRYGNQHGRRHAAAGWRTEDGGIASFGNQGSHGSSYSADSRVKGDVMSGGFGSRGGYRDSYGSDSELGPSGSRRTREISSSFGRSRGGQDFKSTRRISLRPTTELRLEGGGNGSGGKAVITDTDRSWRSPFD